MHAFIKNIIDFITIFYKGNQIVFSRDHHRNAECRMRNAECGMGMPECRAAVFFYVRSTVDSTGSILRQGLSLGTTGTTGSILQLHSTAVRRSIHRSVESTVAFYGTTEVPPYSVSGKKSMKTPDENP